MLVFESRDPQRQAWREWTCDRSFRRTDIPDVGMVESWVELLDVQPEVVSFRWTYVFQSDGTILTSDSTLRFRSRNDVTDSLRRCGFTLEEVRGAPDRPGLEFVFIARRM